MTAAATNTEPVWPNGWVFVYELSGSGFESSCNHLNFRFCACFEQGVPWHSGNYRVWIHSETRTWHDKNIQSFADDLDPVGSSENLKKWWDLLEQEGGKFGFQVQPSKSHIVVKEKYQDKAKQRYFREARSQWPKKDINTWDRLLEVKHLKKVI